MIDCFIRSYLQKIASNPDQVRVIQDINYKDNTCNIMVYVSNIDVGKIIGKNGKMISSIKTLISACKAKDRMNYKVVVVETNYV